MEKFFLVFLYLFREYVCQQAVGLRDAVSFRSCRYFDEEALITNNVSLLQSIPYQFFTQISKSSLSHFLLLNIKCENVKHIPPTTGCVINWLCKRTLSSFGVQINSANSIDILNLNTKESEPFYQNSAFF